MCNQKEKSIKDKRNYDNAELEIVKLKTQYVVAASTDTGNAKAIDDDGRTRVGGSRA